MVTSVGTVRRQLTALGLLLALAACSGQRVEPEALSIDPAGPLSVGVGESVTFDAGPAPEGVAWTVDGVPGADLGAVAPDGTYTAPERVPRDPIVTVEAADTEDATRTASAQVEVTADGTFYVFDEQVFVFGAMDEAAGGVEPDRAFALDGVAGSYYAMALAADADVAFLAVQAASPMLFRVPAVSTLDGTVTDYATFDDAGLSDPSGLAYDPLRDVLYARLRGDDGGALLAFEGAAAAPDGAVADRRIDLAEGQLAPFGSDFDVRLVLDADADRLYLARPGDGGEVAVFDQASTRDGSVAPDRTFSLALDDPPAASYLWGAAHDRDRDELYLADRDANRVYVIAEASTAEGAVAPSRVLGGDANPVEAPSMVGYDAANDRLAVVLSGGAGVEGPSGEAIAVFDGASSIDGDVAPDRLIDGEGLPLDFPYGGYLDPTQ